ncbi:major capsid protein [Polycladidibacter hongkongensis]|uniref:major capsid protein n=1 Tax=Polycladidibacter hongkongensis TaxID=1647556 RepID=UPI00082A4FA9|nr:major capsid protein [Pseudovibrio hongkongensis]
MADYAMGYSAVDLTREVNRLPTTYGLLNAMNIAPISRKKSTYVRIDVKDGIVRVLGSRERGAPGQTIERGKENAIIIEIPHFPVLDQILVDDPDNLLEVVGGKLVPASVDQELLRTLQTIRRSHSLTLEYLRLGMLRGEVVDGDGNQLLDLYDAFDINKKTINFQLNKPDTDVRAKCAELQKHTRDNLMNETQSGVEAVVSTEFFDALISHQNVEKYVVNAQNSRLHSTVEDYALGGVYGRMFKFGNITFREYAGSMPVKENEKTKQAPIIDAGVGHSFPTGTGNLMHTFAAPALHVDSINQPAKQIDDVKISIEPLKHGKGWELESQSNRIAVCNQPQVLAELQAE